jgi:hypothetical protein
MAKECVWLRAEKELVEQDAILAELEKVVDGADRSPRVADVLVHVHDQVAASARCYLTAYHYLWGKRTEAPPAIRSPRYCCCS